MAELKGTLDGLKLYVEKVEGLEAAYAALVDAVEEFGSDPLGITNQVGANMVRVTETRTHSLEVSFAPVQGRLPLEVSADRVLRVLAAADKGLSRDELAERAGLTENQTRNALSTLAPNLAQFNQGIGWRITDTGRDQLQAKDS